MGLSVSRQQRPNRQLYPYALQASVGWLFISAEPFFPAIKTQAMGGAIPSSKRMHDLLSSAGAVIPTFVSRSGTSTRYAIPKLLPMPIHP